MTGEIKNILAIDVGEVRIGLAVANTIAQLPRPLFIIDNNENVFDEIKKIIKENSVDTIVVGLPRNMSGEETKQSEFSRDFAKSLQKATGKKVIFEDEGLTTNLARESNYPKDPSGYLDSIAACIILEEHLKRI